MRRDASHCSLSSSTQKSKTQHKDHDKTKKRIYSLLKNKCIPDYSILDPRSFFLAANKSLCNFWWNINSPEGMDSNKLNNNNNYNNKNNNNNNNLF